MLFDHGTNLLIRSVMGVPQAQGSEPGGDVAARIRAIRGDRQHPYNQPHSADHRRAVEEVAALYARLPLAEPISDEIDIAV